jgi:hypothetical protein
VPAPGSQDTPEPAFAAAHIDGQLARGRQQVKELRQVKLPEVIIKVRRPGPADPGVRACPPGLTQVHPASLTRPAWRGNRLKRNRAMATRYDKP